MKLSEPNARSQTRLVIVTGLSGSGRGTAMHVLEDLGFYCVDNLPVALAPSVVELAANRGPDLKKIALGIDTRERLFFPEWPRFFAELEKAGNHPEVIFLDASDAVLARRYSETRRPHPMAESGETVAEGIRRERVKLAEIRERANRVIDTTTLTVHELREVVTAAVLGTGGGNSMTVSLVSFGYKYGMPVGMDIVLDVRFIPNPFFVPDLRPLTGLDPAVNGYVMNQPETGRFIAEVSRMLEFLLPLYRREGKSYLTIGLGCTGGRHRSPVLAHEIAATLRHAGCEVLVRDHDITK